MDHRFLILTRNGAQPTSQLKLPKVYLFWLDDEIDVGKKFPWLIITTEIFFTSISSAAKNGPFRIQIYFNKIFSNINQTDLYPLTEDGSLKTTQILNSDKVLLNY